MKKNINGIWYLIGFFLVAQFAASFVLYDTPLKTALVQVLAIGAVAAAVVWAWRIFHISRLFVWLYWLTPLSKLPKTTVVIIVAFGMVVGFFFVILTVIYHFDKPPPEPYVQLNVFKDMVLEKEIGKDVILKRYLKVLGPRNVVFFLDLTDGQKKWTYFDNAPPAIPTPAPEWWFDQQDYNITQLDSFPWSFVLMQLMAGLMVSIPFFFFMWLIAGGGLRSSMKEWGTIKQATLQRRPPIFFKEIGGLDNVIEEMGDFVLMLNDPDVAKEFGAKMPKGVLFSGPPGSGKTMLANAVATEAGVPYFFISGSDFGKPLVGLGSETAKHFFDLLRRNAPCIGFIDELDSAVPARGTGNILGHGEGDAVTNTILSELDDIAKKDLPILVIGATNLLEKIDKAAKRDGRFDRQFIIQYPGEEGRAKIIKIQLSVEPTPLGVIVMNNDDPENPIEEYREAPLGLVDELASELAKITAGFSGAALGNLNNETRIAAWRKVSKGLRKGNFIAREDFYEGLPRAITKSHKDDRIRDERELELIAWHEAGHTYFSYLCEGAEPTKLVFMEPHAGYGGMAVHGGDNRMPQQSQILAGIWVSLAGYVVEKVKFGEVSTGPSEDLKNHTLRARAMTHEWGMGDQGPIAIDVLEGQTGDNTYARVRGPISQKAQLDAQKIITDAEDSMIKLLEETGTDNHLEKIGKLAEALREKHMLSEEDIKRVIGDLKQIKVTA